ncbi:MAG TPA: SGNH/GDSL hydrolase family protein [Pyrinomonadaceae bacterium]|jgi:lysophospholipase L1-like esterase|nr:SGNH/GDSL hydrolase family protein [Pyrinomonadaceae bacterium]
MNEGFYRASMVCALASLLWAGAACGLRQTQASRDEGANMRAEQQVSSATAATTPVAYVAFGDSTGVGVGARRGGYVARLFERIERVRAGSSVRNFCVSGAETADVLRGQLTRLDATRPTLITLGIGINDISHGIAPEQFARNYEEIVTRLKSKTDAPIVVTNIPDISTAPRVPVFLHDQVQARIRVFNEHISEIAKRHELLLVDTYDMSREVIPNHPEFFSPDGFHPSDEGYEYWAKMMWPTVKEAIGEQ